jgi:lipoyl synthase
MRAEGVHAEVDEVAAVLADHAGSRWAPDGLVDRQLAPARVVTRGDEVAHDLGPQVRPGERVRIRLRRAGVDPDEGVALRSPKPAWLRVQATMGPEYTALRRTMRGLDLVTVCEEAGCPNIFECWADGTATFMINGERCTRACGFCLVDTRHPLPPDPGEPARVAAAVERMGLAHAVVTAVARDDLADGGAAGFAATIAAIRDQCPGAAVEVLIPDCKGDIAALDVIFEAAPDVLNHNLETVARLQRAVRPSAGYARSLGVLDRGARAGLVTKSGIILGMGETVEEVHGALADLRAVGVRIVTMGQYLRPTARHLPVARWWTPEEFDAVADRARAMGFAHVESSPLTRSSYHAREAASGAGRAGDAAVGATA